MEEKSKMNISVGTAVKGLINGFVSYSILIFFIFFIFSIIINWKINNSIDLMTNKILLFSIPTISSILVFFLTRGICKLSTFDLFKKCKIENENINSVSTKMNVFFIICIIFSVIAIILSLLAKSYNDTINILQLRDIYYSEYSEGFANKLTNNLINDFQNTQTITLIQTLIIETGLLLGIFSLIPTQKKLIEKYNKINT